MMMRFGSTVGVFLSILTSENNAMNPWRVNIFEHCATAIRFMLWIGMTLIAAMAVTFAIGFTYQFLWHSWRYLSRTLFSEPW